MTEQIFRNDGGILESVKLKVPEDEILLSLWRRPSIVVTAMEVGNRTNAGNVLQNSAYARIGIRLKVSWSWYLSKAVMTAENANDI